MIGKSTKEMLDALERQELSSEALVQMHLDHIEKNNEKIGAFLSVDAEGALVAAREVDRKRQAGEPLGALAGIPVGIKDNLNIKGLTTTCGSKFLETFVTPYDATAIRKLREADAILIGKTNMDEFAMGSSTEYSALKKTCNPVNLDYVPGGSSGGSTAAVAADMVPLALGSSTGGSIRQPASFCGVSGMKPSYGRVSRFGLVAFGSSLDQIGPVAKDVDGMARLLNVISGFDSKDSTSVRKQVEDYLPEKSPSNFKVGIVREFRQDNLNPEIQACVDLAVEKLKESGVEIVECSLPHTEYAVPAYYLIATAEASANLARFDGVRYTKRSENSKTLSDMYVNSRSEGFGPEVKRRILLGTYCLSSGYYDGYYLNAQKVRTKIIDDFNTAFSSVDAILAPTSPTTAFKFGEKVEDPVSMYLSDIFTVMANLAGIPALSIPAGFDSKGLPIGVQLMAGHFEEKKLLQIADYMEKLLV